MIKTKASLQSFFQRGDRPTSANFSDLISSFIMLRAPSSALATGLYEVESTASTTAIGLNAFTRRFISNISTTGAARNYLAVTSASGPGGGAAGQAVLNANATASVVSLFGVLPVASLPDASAAAQGVIEVATTAEVSAGSATDLAVTPANLKGSPFLAKARVTFNGSAATVSIRSSYNVSSVAKNSTGNYTIKWKTPFANINYSPVSQGGFEFGIYRTQTVTVSSLRIDTVDANAANVNQSHGTVVVFGDQ